MEQELKTLGTVWTDARGAPMYLNHNLLGADKTGSGNGISSDNESKLLSTTCNTIVD